MGNTITEALWGIEAYKSPTRNQIVNGNPDRNKYKNKRNSSKAEGKGKKRYYLRHLFLPLLQDNATKTYANGIKDHEVDVYPKQLSVVTHMKTLSMDR